MMVKRPPSKRVKPVHSAQWRDGLKVLTGFTGNTATLTRSEERTLRTYLRGPLANGMPQEEAVKLLDNLGWRIHDQAKR